MISFPYTCVDIERGQALSYTIHSDKFIYREKLKLTILAYRQ